MNTHSPSIDTSLAIATNPLPLEDGVADILRKAQRGLKLSLDDLAIRTGIAIPTLQPFLQNPSSDIPTLKKLAFVLNLHGPSLVRHAGLQYAEHPIHPIHGLAIFTTPFGEDMTVNAFLVWDPETRLAASFDTGSSCEEMLHFIQQNNLTLKWAFITHTHWDHLADIERLLSETAAQGYGPLIENPLGLQPAQHGDGFVLGNLRIRVLGTPGHTPGGTSYFIEGLSQPIVVVGDALFAGSMGGAPAAYQDALFYIETRLLNLPLETIICPGHGPLTTVGLERQYNSFFPNTK